MEKKFTFVILNYNSLEETMECVKSIEALAYENKYIVIVDNDSKNQEYFFKTVKNRFEECKNISYLKAEINGGYAKGNNIGIHYAKYVLKSDFVCVINPDAVVVTPDFIEKAIKAYVEYGYALCGPRIMHGNTNGNPLGGYSESKTFVAYRLWEDYRIYYIKKWNLGRFNLIKKFKNKENMTSTVIKEECSKRDTKLLNPLDKECLSGASIIFSPIFLDKYEGFCNKTFLYCEESILAYACYNLSLKLLYCDEIEVRHVGGCSTGTNGKNERERQMIARRVGRESCKTVLKILMHKKTKIYLEKLISPGVEKYEEVG